MISCRAVLSMLSWMHCILVVSALASSHRQERIQSEFPSDSLLPRSTFLHGLMLPLVAPHIAMAFDGGVGGLGKTKPVTGVELFEESSTPIQNKQGIVSAEIKAIGGKPILVEFQSPWPLLPTAGGLEARDLRSSESAFVQVVPAESNWDAPKVFKQILIDSVLASKGKFGAYGAPVDIKVKPLSSDQKASFSVTFTSYTPGMRESERQLWIKPQQVGSTLVLLIVGTTRPRFSSQERSFQKILDSFLAVSAPESNLRAR
eukprot:scaffold9948_cov129-Cylindrotheca_fusiformis.AAC.10